jgi:hypothetical protein
MKNGEQNWSLTVCQLRNQTRWLGSDVQTQRAGKQQIKNQPGGQHTKWENHQLVALGHCSRETVDKKRWNMTGRNKLKTRNRMNCRWPLDLCVVQIKKPKLNTPDPEQKKKWTTRNKIQKQIFKFNLIKIHTTTYATIIPPSINWKLENVLHTILL